MPSGDSAAGKMAQRARAAVRAAASTGGPQPPNGKPAGLDWYAANLEPRDFLDIADEVEYVGTAECLVGSASTTAGGGGMTVQLQVLPAYLHDALDMVQRSSQGVLVCLFFQAPWELFKQDTPAWSHLAADTDTDWATD